MKNSLINQKVNVHLSEKNYFDCSGWCLEYRKYLINDTLFLCLSRPFFLRLWIFLFYLTSLNLPSNMTDDILRWAFSPSFQVYNFFNWALVFSTFTRVVRLLICSLHLIKTYILFYTFLICLKLFYMIFILNFVHSLFQFFLYCFSNL